MDNEYKILLLVRRDVDREDGWDRSALRGTLFTERRGGGCVPGD